MDVPLSGNSVGQPKQDAATWSRHGSLHPIRGGGEDLHQPAHRPDDLASPGVNPGFLPWLTYLWDVVGQFGGHVLVGKSIQTNLSHTLPP